MLELIRYLFQFGKLSSTGESADSNVDLNSTMSLLRVAQDMTSVQAFPDSDVISQ
jgi:hypothetical protein